MTRFAHKLWAMGLPRRAFSTARNDKGLVTRTANKSRASPLRNDKKRVVRRLLRRVFYTARKDNLCASGKKPRARTIRKKL
jgi:hypothetical protein